MLNHWRDEYKRALEELQESGDLRKLAEILEMIPNILEEQVLGEIRYIRAKVARLDEVISNIDEIRNNLNKIKNDINELKEKYVDIDRKVSRVESMLGGLTEATLSRFFIAELERLGYNIIQWRRNYRVDDDGIDLIVVAEKNGVEEHFVVEAKVKPRHSDVGGLLAKADLYEAKLGIKPRPVLAGTWIGREVEAYAKSRGVAVFRL